MAKLSDRETGYDTVVELSGVETNRMQAGSFAEPIVFSPDGRFGLARLTGNTPLTGEELQQALDFAKRFGRGVSDFERYKFHHYYCVLDLKAREVWCHEGFAHDVAWVAGEYVT